MRDGTLLVTTTLLTLGSLLATGQSAIVPLCTAPIWIAAALACRRTTPTAAARQRLATALMMAWSATLLSLWVAWPGPDVGRAVHAHPDFGQHPVLALAGLPWPGVEGNGLGHAHDRIPFVMGVDALLVDFALWTTIAWLALRRRTLAALPGFAPAATVAAFASVVGGWRLVLLFD
ncbi:MAG: hypothetical protein IT455_11115 [Planctomycetes bacterium]|nr:hypothetical protein [Planctomycetota bacterium]